MSTSAEQLAEHPNLQLIKRYYAGCTAADAAGIIDCCTADVVQYMLPAGSAAVRGAEHLARYWQKVVSVIAAEWHVEHGVACDDEAVIEFAMPWTSRTDGHRYLVHGAEWYAFRDGKIAEIRGYYAHGEPEDTGLVEFPYAERGYYLTPSD